VGYQEATFGVDQAAKWAALDDDLFTPAFGRVIQ
jgi:hypothetical protein